MFRADARGAARYFAGNGKPLADAAAVARIKPLAISPSGLAKHFSAPGVCNWSRAFAEDRGRRC
jgi:hypothetical protein